MSLRTWLALLLTVQIQSLRADFAAADPLARGRAWLGEIQLPRRNFVQNGGFEDGLTGWQYFVHKAGGVDHDTPFAGSAAFRLDGVDAERHVYLYQYRIPLETGRTYTLSAAMRTEGLAQANCDFGVLFLINHGWTESAVLRPAAPTTDWTVLTATFSAFPTRPRPDGKPDYSLVAYWPPKSEGKVWIDNVQIEAGDQATAFSDLDLRPGIEALDRLPKLATQLHAAQAALAAFPEAPLSAGLKRELHGIQAQAEGLKADLLGYEALAKEARAGLPARLDAADSALAAAQTLVWTGAAHIPLHDVALPAERPKGSSIDLVCLQGEHRDLGINVASFTSTGFAARLEISELYNEALALAVQPGQWLRGYSVPRLRGYAQPDSMFTDPLPDLGDAGIFQVGPAEVCQVVVSVATADVFPGSYAGNLTLSSLADRSFQQSIPVTLRVLPFRLPELGDVEITDCYGYVGYARPAMIALGVNTFSLPVGWLDVEFNQDGTLARMDFARIAAHVLELLSQDRRARFLFLNMQGMYRVLETRYGWKPTEPPFKRAITAWVQGLVLEMSELGVEASRVIIETFDEPGPGDLPTAVQMARWVKEAAPMLQTHFYASGVSRDAAWAAAATAHDIIAPSVAHCTPETMAFLKGLGRRLWVYDCQANGETLHPLAYYRLMPWLCWQHDIAGWGHFHWFNTSHGRPYRAWDGVEAQNLIYPGQVGTQPVLSRRYLAIRAGHEDYRLLQALGEVVARAPPDKTESVQHAQAFLATAAEQAMELSPRRPGYQTQIVPGLPPDRLDHLRAGAVAHLDALLPVPADLACSVRTEQGGQIVSYTAPVAGELSVHQWREDGWHGCCRQPVDAGAGSQPIPGNPGETDRYWLQLRADDGRIWLGATTIVPRISVDSTAAGYSKRPLNDGVRVAAVKFEPGRTWISSADAVEHWVELDLGEPRQISEVGLWWMTFTGLPRKIMIRTLQGSEWKPVSATPTWCPAAAAVERIAFTPVTTTRLRVAQAPGGGGPGGPNLMGLSEVEVR